MALLDAVLLAVAVSVAAPQATTLRQELEKHRVDPAGLDDADRVITSFAVTSDDNWFAIAYYWYQDTDRLPPELHVRALDRKTGAWRATMLDAETLKGGSALRIARRPGVIYLDLHINPSAGALIVLSEDLTVRARLYGWSSLILPDGRALYENSMVHFAPAHPGSVSLYDPHTGRDVRVYPAQPDSWDAHPRIDRSIRAIELIATNRIRIPVREQSIVLGPDNRGVSSGPARDLSVDCDISGPTPACAVSEVTKKTDSHEGTKSTETPRRKPEQLMGVLRSCLR
jgi:hypothetical protein